MTENSPSALIEHVTHKGYNNAYERILKTKGFSVIFFPSIEGKRYQVSQLQPLVATPAKDTVGSDTRARYNYQDCWAMLKVIEAIEDSKDFAVAFSPQNPIPMFNCLKPIINIAHIPMNPKTFGMNFNIIKEIS